MNKLITRDNIFNQTSKISVKRNAFDLTHKIISSWDMGKLYPVSCHEVYPNDYEKTQVQTKMIMETLLKPIYQNIKIKFKEFDVAYRNLWKHWRNYYTGGRKGDFTAQEPKVNLNCASNIKGSLFDYLGFPLQSQLSGDVYVSAFPFVAYDFIYFWNFINPELQENVVYNIQDELYTSSKNGLDYFTDELGLIVYYGSDFYLVDENGIPLYVRMLGGAGFDNVPANPKIIDNTSTLGFNDRYSYVSGEDNYSYGVILKDGNNIKPFVWDGTNFGKITTAEYRQAVNIGFLYNVNWERDYYTSAHLSQQQGTAYSMPIDISLSGSGSYTAELPTSYIQVLNGDKVARDVKVDLDLNTGNSNVARVTGFDDSYNMLNTISASGTYSLATTVSNLEIPGSSIATLLKGYSTSFSNNDLRLMWQINMIKESVLFNQKNFEYATYLEYFFGRSPNSRDLQQPIYIGGFNLSMYSNEVIQTSESTDSSALGDYGGRAQVWNDGYIDSYTFNEIGLAMMLMYIVPDVTYQSSQGINRQWLRNDRFDYYNPLLSNIGLQEIQNQEIYAQGTSDDTEVFGYTPAFNELRYIPDYVTSDMRDTLDFWHLARKYDSLPVLNSSYLLCRPSKRIYAVQLENVPNITGIINIVKVAYRDMPELAIPQLLDHRY